MQPPTRWFAKPKNCCTKATDREAMALTARQRRPMLEFLPDINAILNSLSACLLVCGWVCIRRRNVAAHRACMGAALVVSASFLACYLLHHFNLGGSKPFPGAGAWRTLYFAVLIPHVVLAIVMLPPIFLTFRYALRGDFVRHRRLAPWTLAVWLYVSITGVVVYWMLYRMQWT